MTGVAPSRALDISLGTSVGVGAGISVSLKRRRRRRQLEFDVHSRSFGVEIDKQIDRERDCLYFDIRTPRRLDWFDGATARA